MARVAVVVLALVLCVLSLAEHPVRAQAEAAELAALKLSQACAESAATFWHRFGYDQPKPAEKGTDEAWSYQSHYDRELKKCLIAIHLTTVLPSSDINTTEQIADAIEGGDPIAVLHTATSVTPMAILLRGNERLEATEQNLTWYKALMTQ